VEGFELLRVEDALLPKLGEMLHVADSTQLGKGRDAIPYPRPYGRLKLEAAWHCVAPDRDAKYQLTKNEVRREINMLREQGKHLPCDKAGQDRTKLDEAGSRLDQATGRMRSATLNEKLLLHGTKPEFVISLLQQGLNERVTSVRGMLGAGVYLAEDAEKVDQYCHPDSGDRNPELEELHRILFPNEPDAFRHPAWPKFCAECGKALVPGDAICTKCGAKVAHVTPGSVNDLFYVFVVRALCGYVAYSYDEKDTRNFHGADKRELCEVPGSKVRFHSLIFDGSSKGFRYREFVSFHSDRTHIEYLLAYRRV
jgi:hypothetical protein